MKDQIKAVRSEGSVSIEQHKGGGQRNGQGYNPSGSQSLSKLEDLPGNWVLISYVDSHHSAQ